jgi:hypothetical protein
MKDRPQHNSSGSPSQPAPLCDLGKAILDGAVNDDSKEVALELAEIGLHSVLEEGVLKEVPMLRTVLAAWKTRTAIHDRLFLRKVASFIRASPKFTQDERESFAREHLSDPEKTKKLSDAIVLILDKLDDLDKPLMLAKVFAALVRGKIDLESFRRLATAIDIGFLSDLRALCEKSALDLHAGLAQNLLRTGLVEIDEQKDRMAVAQVPGRLWLAYRLNNLGKTFINCTTEADAPA